MCATSAIVHGRFRGCTIDRESLSHTTDLGVVAYPCIAASADPTCSRRPSCSTWDDPVLAVEDLSSPKDKYIRWYRDITRVYIGNPANRYIRTVGYQSAEGKDGARRLPGGRACGGQAPAPPYMGRGGHADPGRGGERDEGSRGYGRGDLGSSYHVNPFDSPNLGISSLVWSPDPSGLGFSSFQRPPPPSTGSSSFQAPPYPGTGSSSFQAPPPPGMVSSSTLHMPISTTSSSDSDEHDDEQTDVVTPAQ
ncbi:hypothetical protein M9H77_12731 [Catharanthus roseus]|uniref:Uncharacterized protein n=1 Tax=Catharanthus roseus TaxID=4058 RepID=A0ACC0BI89_CATRO|nr:hypothetical protein M9H77_12731 [Catharanthus roseus]